MQDADRLNIQQLISGHTGDGTGYKSLREQYKSFKENFVKYVKFDPVDPNLGKYFFSPTQIVIFAF